MQERPSVVLSGTLQGDQSVAEDALLLNKHIMEGWEMLFRIPTSLVSILFSTTASSKSSQTPILELAFLC